MNMYSRFNAMSKEQLGGFMSKLRLAALAFCAIVCSKVAHAQCAPAFTSPGTYKATQANPALVSGTITVGWQANCPQGESYNQVEVNAGCNDSINPTCSGWINPFTNYPNAYYQQIFNVPTNATSIQFDTTQFAINEDYDVSLVLLNNGVNVGTTNTNCPVDQFGHVDCDIVLQVDNTAPPPPPPSPPAGPSCSPIFKTPVNGAIISGTTTVTVDPNCNESATIGGFFVRLYTANGQLDGGPSFSVNTTKFENGATGFGAIVWNVAGQAAGTVEYGGPVSVNVTVANRARKRGSASAPVVQSSLSP
jgi:hypothetical protein